MNRDDLYLYHHGIKGMKWGIRRYQNEDGSLTSKGKKRYYNDDGSRSTKQFERHINELSRNAGRSIVEATNLRATSEYYSKKAKLSSAKGKTEKAAKFNSRAIDAAKLYNKEMSNYINIGYEYMKAMDDLDKSGYSWKTKSASRIIQNYRTEAGKEYLKKHGLFSMVNEVNYANSNQIKVSDKLPENKKDIWKAKQDKRMIKEIGSMNYIYA